MGFEPVRKGFTNLWTPTKQEGPDGTFVQKTAPLNDASEQLEGHYLGCDSNMGPEGKSKLHHLKVGEVDYCFWGTKVLDDQLAVVPKGTLTRVVWKGKVKSKANPSMQPYHNWEVLTDEQAPKIKVAERPSASPAPATQEAVPVASEEEITLDGKKADDLPF